MRYNVTLDDSMGEILDRIAERESTTLSQITPVDLIRKAVIDHYSTPWSKPLDTKEFIQIKQRPIIGMYIKIGKEFVLFEGEKTSHPSSSFKVDRQISCKAELASLLFTFDPEVNSDKKKSVFYSKNINKTFTVAKKSGESDCYILCKMSNGVAGNIVTYDTLEKSEEREAILVNGYELNTFFVLI